MKMGVLGALLLLLLVSAAGGSAVNITDAASLSSHAVLVVAHTLRNCGHCQRLKNGWQSLAADGVVVIGAIDCDDPKVRSSLCRDVHSFPTISLFRFGRLVTRYTGPRDLASLRLFAAKQAGPALRTVGSRDDWRGVPDVVFLEGRGCEQNASVAEVAEELRSRFFFVQLPSAAPNCAAELNGVSWDGHGPLKTFVEIESVPPVAAFDKQLHAGSGRPVAYLFHEDADPGDLTAVRVAARRLRAAHVLFAHVATSVWDGRRAGVVPPYPAMALVDTARLNHHFAKPADVDLGNADELVAWIERCLAGAVNRTLVSEAAQPERNDDGTLRVVGATLQRLVLDEARDVLVFFQSPACGSSQSSWPFWRSLVEATRHSAGLKLAVADGWANDWPAELGLSGLPDFRLFAADDKRLSAAKRYRGPREVKACLEWLREAAYNSLSDGAGEL